MLALSTGSSRIFTRSKLILPRRGCLSTEQAISVDSRICLNYTFTFASHAQGRLGSLRFETTNLDCLILISSAANRWCLFLSEEFELFHAWTAAEHYIEGLLRLFDSALANDKLRS